MNNVQYLGSKIGLLTDVFDAIADEKVDKGRLVEMLGVAGVPGRALESPDSMQDWLFSERTVGAWEPGESVASITRNVNEFTYPYDYLDSRGIENESLGEDEAFIASIKDLNLRWQAVYMAEVNRNLNK